MKEFEKEFEPGTVDVQLSLALTGSAQAAFARERRLALLVPYRAHRSSLVSRTVLIKLANLFEQIELSVGDIDDEGYKQISGELLAAKLAATVRNLWRWRNIADELGDLKVMRGRSADRMRPAIWWRVEWGSVARRGQLHNTATDMADEETQSYASCVGETDVQMQDPAITSCGAGDINVPRSEPTGECVDAQHRRFAQSGPLDGPPGAPGGPIDGPHRPDLSPSNMTNVTQDSEVFPTNTKSLVSKKYKDYKEPKLQREGLGGSFSSRRERHFVLTLESLSNVGRLDEWFDWAVATGKTLSIFRLEVFAVARAILRCRDELANPPGAFFSVVRNRLWLQIDRTTGRPKFTINAEDDEWARQTLRDLDRDSRSDPVIDRPPAATEPYEDFT